MKLTRLAGTNWARIHANALSRFPEIFTAYFPLASFSERVRNIHYRRHQLFYRTASAIQRPALKRITRFRGSAGLGWSARLGVFDDASTRNRATPRPP